MKHILLVEDEESIATPLQRLLVSEGYQVTWAKTVGEARSAATHDLVILDWTLPDGQGIDVLRDWRARGVSTPVIFLTARHELVDKVLGFEMGADDYLTKPFEARELLVRVKARLRSPSKTKASSVLTHGAIQLDEGSYKVTFRDLDVEMTKMEFALLKLFLSNVGRVFSRDEILNQVWGFEAYPTTRTVDTHVLQLRQKLSSEVIETVRGVGYRMSAAKESVC